jgi:hypothetical protein
MTCEYAELDGAYVLGALSPTERREFEAHLSGCDECSRAVRELAGLPGLLARVDPVVLEPAPDPGTVPTTLLPALVAEVSRVRRRRVFATAGLAAAAAVAVGVVAVQGLTGDSQEASPPAGTPTSAVPVGQAMSPIGHVPVKATLAFTSVKWGTKLDLTCSYEQHGGEYHLPSSMTYALIVVERDGKTEQVGTWKALLGKTMRLTAGTAASRDQIVSVEVRTTDGRPVLKLAS